MQFIAIPILNPIPRSVSTSGSAPLCWWTVTHLYDWMHYKFREIYQSLLMVWRRHTWQMCAPRSRLSSAGGSCGQQTVGHSSCRAQGPRSVGGTLPWLARPLGTASLSTCGLHHHPEIHLRKNSKLIYLAASALEVFSNRVLYKLTYSFIHSMPTSTDMQKH